MNAPLKVVDYTCKATDNKDAPYVKTDTIRRLGEPLAEEQVNSLRRLEDEEKIQQLEAEIEAAKILVDTTREECTPKSRASNEAKKAFEESEGDKKTKNALKKAWNQAKKPANQCEKQLKKAATAVRNKEKALKKLEAKIAKKKEKLEKKMKKKNNKNKKKKERKSKQEVAKELVAGQCVADHVCADIRGDPHITTFDGVK